jgi:hypothetical protein
MHAAIQRQYDAGRSSSMTQDELLALARDYLPQHFGSGARPVATISA